MNALSSQQVLIMVRFLPLHASISLHNESSEGHDFMVFESFALLLASSLLVRQQCFPSLNACEWEDGHAVKYLKIGMVMLLLHLETEFVMLLLHFQTGLIMLLLHFQTGMVISL